VYHIFVKQFGGANSSFTFRWGYGWNYKRPYEPITALVEEQVKNLYGPSDKQQTKNALAKTTQLNSTCADFDIGIRKLGADEKAIYQYLNSTLVKNARIGWAKTAYFNLERKEYVVKLDGCDQPIQFILTRDPSKIKEIKNSCL
jgi:hypothetical protein